MAKNKKKKVITLRKKDIKKIKREDGLKMINITEYTFRDFVDSISSLYGNRIAYTKYKEEVDADITFTQLKQRVNAIGTYLLNMGIKKGDKLAIFAESNPNWMVFYLGVTSIGAIAVPLLPAFSSVEAKNALKHSGAIGVCIQTRQFSLVSEYLLENKLHIFRFEDLFHIENNIKDRELDNKNFLTFPGVDITHTKINKKALAELPLNEDDVASIIYTSGTTGNSKGVVLTHKNILRNADRCTVEYVKIKPGDRVLSILPMSHVYEFTIGHVLTLMAGCQIYVLGRAPAVSILLPALKEVRPHFMMSVPLLMEKVYKAAVVPVLKGNKRMAKIAKNPLTGWLIYSVIGNKLKSTFGNRLKFFGIGGAPLDPEVEKFLYRANFPYAIGYGLTETSPLLAGCGPRRKQHKVGYIGNIMPDVTMKLVNVNAEGIGEVAVKGPSIFQGYYNNDQLNEESFDKDGYFLTGDLGMFDKKRKLALKGRSKTIILSAAGENIYPESIESVINNKEFVEESLVVPEGGGLLALVKIDIELMAKKLKLDLDDAKKAASEYVASLRKEVNEELSSGSKIDSVDLQEEPFDRTATQKIKRFLYPKLNKKDNKDEKEEK